MSISDIISSVLAGLTFLGIVIALGIGVFSLLQTRNLEKTRYKQSMYNDILNWLQDLLGCEANFTISTIAESEEAFKSAHCASEHHSIVAGNISNEFMRLFNKGIALSLLLGNNTDSLAKEMKELGTTLRTMSRVYTKYRKKFIDTSINFDELSKLKRKQNTETKNIRKRMRDNAEKIAKLIIERMPRIL